ncbi:toll/interleukin-1 receptor domain-containing protein [Mesorhizobium sp. LjRoot246]|uniref:toll/interleukin-1 receptor domain-containing protein n=1 Tax=Mesorhizobium sp. LjRoot246 TaxID=3342294 RepID=UPI003ECCBA07
MYEHDVFVSYRRSPNVGAWVQRHLVPLLQSRMDEIAPRQIRVFCDYKMEDGVNWPSELRNRVRFSSLLLTVWSADYFRSAWCMAEWQSFRDREQHLGLFSDEMTLGLVYPLRYADGKYYHPDAQLTLCRKDFSELNYPSEVFRESTQYLKFDALVQAVARELVDRLEAVPPWQEDFPIIEPKALPAVILDRTVL